MRARRTISFRPKKYNILFYVSVFVLLNSTAIHAQELPPKPINVYVNPAYGLNFGSFFQGVSGGTVNITPDGLRSTTGDIIQADLGVPFSPAVFEIDANPGTLISILNGPDAILTGSNGGSVSIHIGSANTGSPFITTVAPPGRTEVWIGGTLTVGNSLANPAGNYNGTISVIFIQE